MTSLAKPPESELSSVFSNLLITTTWQHLHESKILKNSEKFLLSPSIEIKFCGSNVGWNSIFCVGGGEANIFKDFTRIFEGIECEPRRGAGWLVIGR